MLYSVQRFWRHASSLTIFLTRNTDARLKFDDHIHLGGVKAYLNPDRVDKKSVRILKGHQLAIHFGMSVTRPLQDTAVLALWRVPRADRHQWKLIRRVFKMIVLARWCEPAAGLTEVLASYPAAKAFEKRWRSLLLGLLHQKQEDVPSHESRDKHYQWHDPLD